VPVASTCTSALPGGQPLPRSEIPWILTFEGAFLGVTAPRTAEARLREIVRMLAIYILDYVAKKSRKRDVNEAIKSSNRLMFLIQVENERR
jgi:hypothetical protein